MMNTRRLKAEIIAEYNTQDAFANAMGWHKNKVSKMIQGHYKPNIDEVAKMVEMLHLDERQYCHIFLPQKSPYGDNGAINEGVLINGGRHQMD